MNKLILSPNINNNTSIRSLLCLVLLSLSPSMLHLLDTYSRVRIIVIFVSTAAKVIFLQTIHINLLFYTRSGEGSVVGIATGYGLDGPGIETPRGRDFPHLSRPVLGPTQTPVQWVPVLSRGVKSSRSVNLTPHPLLVPWSRRGRAIPLLPLWAVRPVQSLSACTRATFTFTFTFTHATSRTCLQWANNYNRQSTTKHISRKHQTLALHTTKYSRNSSCTIFVFVFSSAMLSASSIAQRLSQLNMSMEH